MRKFTKDISALLASVAVGTAAFAGAVSVSSELVGHAASLGDETTTTMATRMAGETIANTAITTTSTTTTTHTIGTMTEPDYTEPTGYYPPTDPLGAETHPIGTQMAPDTTKPTETFRTDPIGTMMPTTTTTEETFITQPIGTVMGTTTTAVTTTTTTEPEIPPLMGDIAPADGDINDDGDFGVTDIVVFQKWMHGISTAKYIELYRADLDYDGKTDIFDLALMKRKLLRETVRIVVEPENRVSYGSYMNVTENLKMYLGPDTNYHVIDTIPNGEVIQEVGYQTGNNTWMFTEYNGKKGWIRLLKADNKTPTVYYWATVEKPVIYLYPEQKIDVRVTLELTESELATTYPKYQDGWNVTAYPDGSLLNKADGSHHKSLFWDSVNCSTRFDFSKGFCVAGSDTERFFKEKLTYIGMTENEMNEFIVYWLPRMERNAYNLISFQDDAYTNSAKLQITPAPDSVCRVFMAYIPMENAVKIEPQQLETFERKGFTVVEWGGTEIASR